MPKAKDVKTKSAPSAINLAVFIVIAALLVGTILATQSIGVNQTTQLRVGAYVYDLELAKTTKAQEKGLGGRASMPANRGMLFEFNHESIKCFWMLNMHFPLDMIWLNVNKRIVYIKQNVSPATYPDSFCPKQPAEYVIELNAGQVRVAGVHDGQTLSF